MALTNQQVQQVFLAIAGRPAEGSAVTWGANSLSIAALANSVIDIRKGADFANSKETFVENLYQNLLGRASDAEGKEFWLKALNDGASYGDVLAQFINAVLAQSQTADLYTIQNKLNIAEQISAQVPSFTGANAESTLKDLMATVDANTTIENLSNDIEDFKGQNVNISTVSVNTKADNDTATEGSEEHASVFNATVSILGGTISTDESSLLLTGSTNYTDTLNLTLKSSKDVEDKQTVDLDTVLADVSDIEVINLNVKDGKISGVSGAANDFDLKIDGTSIDKISVSNGKTVDTGAGNDEITVKGRATVKAGAGNDQIILDTAASGAAISIDGGAGRDTVTFSGSDNTVNYTRVTLSNIEALAGKGMVKSSLLHNKTYTLESGVELAASGATNGIDLSKLKLVDNATGVELTVQDVKSGTVTLVKSENPLDTNPTTDTIKLAADATKVTINNIASGDSLDLTGTAISSVSGSAAKYESSSAIATNTIKFVDAGRNVDTVAKALEELSGGSFSATSGKALIAFNNGNGKAYLYSADANGATTIGTTTDLKLIAIVDNNIDTKDNAATTTGILEFV